jgi:hypothetical protein
VVIYFGLLKIIENLKKIQMSMLPPGSIKPEPFGQVRNVGVGGRAVLGFELRASCLQTATLPVLYALFFT